MKLKTYTAETMAQALGQVRKDLGKDAMILHTRSFRVGAWFGLGGKAMVEITASSPANSTKLRTPRLMPRVVPTQTIEPKPLVHEPEIVIQRGRTVTRQRLEHAISTTQSAQGVMPSSDPCDQEESANGIADDRGLIGRDALFADESPIAQPSIPARSSVQRRSNPTVDSVAPRFADQPIVSAMIPTPKPKSKSKTKQGVPTRPSKAKTPDQETNVELRTQIDSLQKMMGHVLESTRKTAVAIGSANPQNALPNGDMSAPLFDLYAKMLDNDVPVELADQLVGSVRDRLDALELKDPMIVRQTLLRSIESTIQIRSESLLSIDHNASTGRPRVIVLVGPTGVGKTTTVAKLAATYKLRHGKNVGLVTSDTYRIAAVEQLRTYAGIIGLPLKVANSPEELAQAIESLSSCDIVVVDTAGRSQNNARRLEELAEFTKAANPDETHLVLSTTVGDNVLRKTAQRFKALGPDRCILTKLDEAVTTGPIAGLSDRIGLPLSFITVGQEVPDDLEPARADRLARCVLDGPEAVVGRWSEDNG